MITGGRGAIFVDGSRLFSSIFEIWRTRPDCSNKKAHVGELSNALIRALGPLFGVVVRVTYYFKKADDRMQKLLTIPDATQPSQKSHWRIIECGQSLTAIPDPNSTSKCNTCGFEDLRRGSEAEAFPRPVIEPAFDRLYSAL